MYRCEQCTSGYFKYLCGYGGVDGKRVVCAEKYGLDSDDMVTKIHLAAADVGAGGIVLIPDGTYLDCIQFDPIQYVTYQGAGMYSTVLKAAAGAVYVMRLFNVGLFELRDLTLQGYNYATNGIYFYNSGSSFYHRVRFYSMKYFDLNISGHNRFVDCQWREFYQNCVYNRVGSYGANWFIRGLFERASLQTDDLYAAVRLTSNTLKQVFQDCKASTWGTPQHKYGFQIDAGCADNEFVGGHWIGKTDDWLDNGTNTHIDIIHNVNGRQNLNNNKLQVVTDLVTPRLSQAVQPTPVVGGQVYWHDNVNAKLYLVFNDPVLGVKKVELP